MRKKFPYSTVQVIDMVYDADLRDSPIDGELLEGMYIKFGPKLGITATSQYFQGEYHRFSNILYSALNHGDILPLHQGDQAKDILEKCSPTRDGFVVLQDFLLLFHPSSLRDNQAPSFPDHTAKAPQYTLTGNQTTMDVSLVTIHNKPNGSLSFISIRNIRLFAKWTFPCII